MVFVVLTCPEAHSNIAMLYHISLLLSIMRIIVVKPRLVDTRVDRLIASQHPLLSIINIPVLKPWSNQQPVLLVLPPHYHVYYCNSKYEDYCCKTFRCPEGVYSVIVITYCYISKHGTLTKCWFYVGPPSATLA